MVPDDATVAYISTLDGSREERAFELAKHDYYGFLDYKEDRYTTYCVRCGSTYARTASQTSPIFRTGAMRTTTAGLRHSIADFRRLSRNTSTGVFIREEVEPVDGFTSEKGIGT